MSGCVGVCFRVCMCLCLCVCVYAYCLACSLYTWHGSSYAGLLCLICVVFILQGFHTWLRPIHTHLHKHTQTHTNAHTHTQTHTHTRTTTLPPSLHQSTSTFTFLLTSLEAGLKSLDVSISSASAAAVDNIAGFYFRNVIQGVGDG